MRYNFVTMGLAAIVAATVTACAQSPESIVPVSMGNAFTNVSCNEARAMLNQERITLAALEARQRNAVTGDAIGVFLIGVPVSSLAGNRQEGEIGVGKGRVLALETRLMSC